MKTVAIGAQAIVGPMKFALNLAANGIMNLAAGEQIEEYKSKAAFNLTVFFTGRNTEEDIKALDASNELAKIEHAKGNKDYPLDGDGQVVASRFLIDAVLGEFKSIGAKAGGRVLSVSGTPVIGKPTIVGDKGIVLPNIPGRVKSRINLKNDGMEHLISRHLSGKSNASQFSITEIEVRDLLQSKVVVNSPIKRIVNSEEGIRYVREVDVGRPIGKSKFSDQESTSIMTVMTDRFGDLVTAFPGVLK